MKILNRNDVILTGMVDIYIYTGTWYVIPDIRAEKFLTSNFVLRNASTTMEEHSLSNQTEVHNEKHVNSPGK